MSQLKSFDVRQITSARIGWGSRRDIRWGSHERAEHRCCQDGTTPSPFAGYTRAATDVPGIGVTLSSNITCGIVSPRYEIYAGREAQAVAYRHHDLGLDDRGRVKLVRDAPPARPLFEREGAPQRRRVRELCHMLGTCG